MSTLVDVKDLARGKWDQILVAIGIGPDLLDGKHHACPICGGKDRFRFNDKFGNGEWTCHSHGFRPGKKVGNGNGIELFMDFMRISKFQDAANEVRRMLGAGLPEIPESTRKPKDHQMSSEENQKWVNWLLKTSRPAKPKGFVERYLRSRGLAVQVPQCLRFKPDLNYCHDDETRERMRAMLAPITDVHGNTLAVHRTYLRHDCAGKADVPVPKRIAGNGFSGGSIKLYEPVNGFIALTEGIETAIAVHELYGYPTWATIATGFMVDVVLPEDVTQVVIMADHDPIDPKRGVKPGLDAALTLGKRLREEGRTVKIQMPTKEGYDYLDVLLEVKGLK